MEEHDREKLQELASGKLGGVMFHTANFEAFTNAGLKGFATMHHWRALEEYNEYMHLVKEYIHMFDDMPEVESPLATKVRIDPSWPILKKFDEGIESYSKYEMGVLEDLRLLKVGAGTELHKIICNLCDDVREELLYISDVEKHIECCATHEEYLQKIDDTLSNTFKHKLAVM